MRLRVQCMVLLALAGAACCWGAEPRLCYAFILRADVFVTCQGNTTQITRREDLRSFAISDEEAAFVYTTPQALKRSGRASWGGSTATVINLRTGGERKVDSTWRVEKTCGGIYTASGVGRIPRRVDLAAGGELKFPPYDSFRCSSDRRIVAGFSRTLGGGLYAGAPPRTKIADAKAAGATEFDVSPNGSKVAYFNSPSSPLCVANETGPVTCVDDTRSMADPPSVNDAGEVLVTAAAGIPSGCGYKSSTWFMPGVVVPGGPGDECLAIGYWRPGLKEIELIERLGRMPQWIKPETAQLLRGWAASQPVPTGK
jgi:hypothetical protein